MESRTERLPKGRGYPLKPSFLAAAYGASGLNVPLRLTRWDRFDHAFQVDYMPNGLVKQPKHPLFWVRCRAVSTKRVGEARRFIENKAIPQFIEWARKFNGLNASSTIRWEKQTFHYSLVEFDE